MRPRSNAKRPRGSDLVVNRFELQIVVEDLDAPVAAVSDVDIALGIGGSLAAARLLSGMLYGVQPADPRTLAGVSLLLLASSALASFLPARRAANVEPVVALRHE